MRKKPWEFGASQHQSPPPRAEALKALELDPLQHLENLRRVKVEQSFRQRRKREMGYKQADDGGFPRIILKFSVYVYGTVGSWGHKKHAIATKP